MSFEIKRLTIYFSISLLFAGYLFGQNCQIVLITEKRFANLELNTLTGDTLVVSQPNGQSMQIPVEEIKEISLERKSNFNHRVKKLLTGTMIGAVLGSVSGLLFSDFALRWLSNKENPKGWISNRDLSEGDKAIVGVFTGMSTLIGILHGFDWGMEKSKNIKRYDLSQKTIEEKTETIREIVRMQEE